MARAITNWVRIGILRCIVKLNWTTPLYLLGDQVTSAALYATLVADAQTKTAEWSTNPNRSECLCSLRIRDFELGRIAWNGNGLVGIVPLSPLDLYTIFIFDPVSEVCSRRV